MTVSLRVAIAGATGRMGIALIKALSAHPTLELTAAGVRPGTQSLACNQLENAGLAFACGMLVETPAELFKTADAVIDFSAPECLWLLSAKLCGGLWIPVRQDSWAVLRWVGQLW